MKVVAIIQARMGSTRFPGKVMKEINGQPMLWHVVNRLSYSKLVNEIVVATTRNREDKIIADFCRDNSISCFRGSQEDVLDRYYHAALVFKADVVVRITSDCPLIDPAVADKVISAYFKKKRYAGASNVVKRTYPRGLDTEVFAFTAIKQAWASSQEQRYREHVTKYLYEYPDKYKILSVVDGQDNSDLRLTVDEERDLHLVRAIYARLGQGRRIFKLKEIIALLRKEPVLADLNNGVKQKASIN